MIIINNIAKYSSSLQEMDDVSYWVGATDEAEEGKWVWSSDGTDVKSGTPIWGYLYGVQPDGGTDQNCGTLYVKDFFYMHDELCSESTYGVICQPSKSSLVCGFYIHWPLNDNELYSNPLIRGVVFKVISRFCPFQRKCL